MLNRNMAARMPALTLAEAAMLPALPGETPRNLLIPRPEPEKRPLLPENGGQVVDNPVRRGTMAGRALLRHIQNASARRQRR